VVLEEIHVSLALSLCEGIIYACPGLTVSLGHLLLVTVKEETLGEETFSSTDTSTLTFVVLQFLESKKGA